MEIVADFWAVANLTGLLSIDTNGSLCGAGNGLFVFDAVLLECDLLADNDVSLDAEVSELATLCQRFLDALFVRAALGLLLMDVTVVWGHFNGQLIAFMEVNLFLGGCARAEFVGEFVWTSATDGGWLAYLNFGVKAGMEAREVKVTTATALIITLNCHC